MGAMESSTAKSRRFLDFVLFAGSEREGKREREVELEGSARGERQAGKQTTPFKTFHAKDLDA